MEEFCLQFFFLFLEPLMYTKQHLATHKTLLRGPLMLEKPWLPWVSAQVSSGAADMSWLLDCTASTCQREIGSGVLSTEGERLQAQPLTDTAAAA